MAKKKTPAVSVEEEEKIPRPPNPYIGIGDKCRLSERTIRYAFARKPITWQTANKIAKAIGIDIHFFRIKTDNRGLTKPVRLVQKVK